MQLSFVTSNESKVKEVEAILGFSINTVKADLDEIQSLDLEEIIVKKTKAAFSAIKKPLIVDDAGLYIDCWNGFPGPFIKYLHQAGGLDLLLHMMSHETNRKAQFKAMVGFHDGKKIHVFMGEVHGEIATEKRGENGWGHDPVFIVENTGKTFAQMSTERKNSMSHRRRALEKLKDFLKKK